MLNIHLQSQFTQLKFKHAIMVLKRLGEKQNKEEKIIKETFGSKIIKPLRLLFCQHIDDYVSYGTHIIQPTKVRDIIMIKTQSCGLLYSCIGK